MKKPAKRSTKKGKRIKPSPSKTGKPTIVKFDPDNTVKRKKLRAKIKSKVFEVRQLKQNSWSPAAVERLFFEAKQVVEENEYLSLTRLWVDFGLSSQIIKDLLKRFPEHAYIYLFIKSAVESYIWEAAAEGRMHSNLALFTLKANYGWVDPKTEAEKDGPKITLNISDKLSKLLE